MKPMIEISNITKKYKETTALNEISLMNETRLRRKLKILFKTVDRHMGTAASGLSEAVPQGYIHQCSHKRQAERLSCRY